MHRHDHRHVSHRRTSRHCCCCCCYVQAGTVVVVMYKQRLRTIPGSASARVTDVARCCTHEVELEHYRSVAENTVAGVWYAQHMVCGG